MTVAVGLSACSLEIWEGEVYTENGDILYNDRFFSKSKCRAETAAQLNSLGTDGRKKIKYSAGGWAEQDPYGYRCRLKHKIGF